MIAQLVLLFLLLSALAYFLSSVFRRLAGMRGARPPLPRVDLGRRLPSMLFEVLLQTRVIRGRPLAGFLHALVMWGFFAFAWVTVEHVHLGFSGLENAAPSRSWYETFAAVWAVAVLAGIVGLAWRRFVVRPPQLGRFRLRPGSWRPLLFC